MRKSTLEAPGLSFPLSRIYMHVFRNALAGVGLLAGVLCYAQSSPSASRTPSQQAPAGVEAIWAYAGTWKTDMTHLDTAYSKAGHESSVLKNDCWKSGAYVACRQIVDGDPKILLVFTYDPKDGTYTSYQIPPQGGDAGSGKLLIQGNTWIFPWTVTDAGKTTYFRVVNVWSSPTTIDFRQEFSADQKTWTPMATGHEVKVTGP